MPGGILGGVVDAIMSGPEGQKPLFMSIIGVDMTDPTGDYILPEKAFQFWPESISDTIEIGWSFKEITGASHALAQWGSNGGRTISFEVTLSKFQKNPYYRNQLEILLDPFETTGPDKDPKWNPSVRGGLRYLRAYCYPSYKQGEDFVEAYPPPVALLNVPGVGLNEDGSDAIWAIMTGCDITYVLLFPNGEPRLATASLTFRQIVQNPRNNAVLFSGLRNPTQGGKYLYNNNDYNGAGHHGQIFKGF